LDARAAEGGQLHHDRQNGEPSMLRIYDVADDSILLEFGFRDGDIIALVNGELPVFTPSRTVEYARKAYSFIDDLQNGKPISITVLRNGQPVNLVYQKW
jgi:type II secretory pathway component PulC